MQQPWRQAAPRCGVPRICEVGQPLVGRRDADAAGTRLHNSVGGTAVRAMCHAAHKQKCTGRQPCTAAAPAAAILADVGNVAGGARAAANTAPAAGGAVAIATSAAACAAPSPNIPFCSSSTSAPGLSRPATERSAPAVSAALVATTSCVIGAAAREASAAAPADAIGTQRQAPSGCSSSTPTRRRGTLLGARIQRMSPPRYSSAKPPASATAHADAALRVSSVTGTCRRVHPACVRARGCTGARTTGVHALRGSWSGWRQALQVCERWGP
eukprot:352249-Chlamydomonas_euryale.AAC.6